jgi:putative ABC transport system permease protein
VWITLGLFGAFFLLALITNLRQVHIANPIGLLSGARQGEREPKAGWLGALLGLAFLSAGYIVALYFKNPMDTLIFFLLAVLLVIIGTFFLFNALSVAMLKLLRSNKKYYYKPNHFITVSGMIYRMKQNAAGLAAICILSCMVLVTVSSTVSLNIGAEDSLNARFPYDYDIHVDKTEDAPVFANEARNLARLYNADIINISAYDEVIIAAYEADGIFTVTDGFQSITLFTLLTLDDYNRNEGKDVKLNPNEALILVTGGRYDRPELTLNGHAYKVTPLNKLGKMIYGSPSTERELTLVLPSQADAESIINTVAPDTEMTRRHRMTFDIEGTDEDRLAFKDKFIDFMNSREDLRGGYGYTTKDSYKESWYMTNGGFLFLGIYLGTVFMLATALIIYYKQISEGYDDAGRFEILQKVGMSDAEVKRTINRQILTVFFIPLVVAVIHISVAFFPISRVMVIFGVINTALLITTTAATVIVYVLVYLLVFRRTAGTYFKIVRRGA